MPRPSELLLETSDKVAVVGVGDTDYAADYAAYRQGTLPPSHDSLSLAVTAFKRALDDCGLRKDDIDGLGVGWDLEFERTAEVLGLRLTWGAEKGLSDVLIPAAVNAICSGQCETVALVHGGAQRSMAYSYSSDWARTHTYINWYYHLPWGLSAASGHYAMAAIEHRERFGSTEEQLGAVAIAQRKHAALNPNAIMRTPMTLDDYMASRYIARPLHLFDCTLINDGGVVLILTTAERAKHLRKPPVLVSGIGRHGDYTGFTQMRVRRLDHAWDNVDHAVTRCLGMARLDRGDIGQVGVHEAFSPLVPMFFEGAGFCGRGEGWEYIQDGRIELGGDLPVNTSGGGLSESHTNDWNMHPEAVRQLRHEAGDRQVRDVHNTLFCHHGHWGAVCISYRRGM